MGKRKISDSGKSFDAELAKALNAMLLVLDWQKQLVCWALDHVSSRSPSGPQAPGKRSRGRKRPGRPPPRP